MTALKKREAKPPTTPLSFIFLLVSPRLKRRMGLDYIRYALLSRIPGTFSFRLRVGRRVLKKIRKSLTLLYGVKGVPEEFRMLYDKKLVFSQFQVLSVNEAVSDFIHDYGPSMRNSTVIINLIISTFISVFFIRPSNLGTLIVNIVVIVFIATILGAVLFYAFALIFFFIFNVLLRFIGFMGILFPLLILIIFIVFTAIRLIYFLFPNPNATTYLLLVNALIYVIINSSIISLNSYKYIIIEHFERRYPTSLIITRLIEIIQIIGTTKNDWQETEGRQQQLLKLEEVARCIEYFIPQQFHSADSITDVWLKKTTEEAANFIREKKRWVLTPMKDTREHLNEELIYTLRCILDSDWDGLKKMKSEDFLHELPHPRLIRSRVVEFSKLIFIATLPVAVFFFIQATPWHISGSSRDYVIIGLFIWGFLTLISPLDPAYNTKITAIKDITSSILPGPKS